MTLTYNVTGSGTLGTPKVLTLGAPDLDFTLVSGSTCTGSVIQGNTCIVKVKFAPLHPGARNGAVEIVDGSGNVLANTYIYGTGSGPQIGFSTTLQSDLAVGLSYPGFFFPAGVAVDGYGNVFVSDYFDDEYQGSVKEILAADGYTRVKILAIGFVGPRGVAVDGSGNVFVSDGDGVHEFTAASDYTTLLSVGGLTTYCFGVAVDGSGNLFVADNTDSAVKEILAAGGYTTVDTLASGFNQTSGVAVDGSGNVFVTNFGNNAVKEILAAGGYTTINSLGNGYYFGNPFGVAVDGSGDVFVAEEYYSEVLEILAAGGYSTVNTLTHNLASPYGVAVDGGGNLFVTNFAVGGPVVEINRSQPSALNFGTIAFGASATLPLTITNTGNAALTVSPSIDGPSYTIAENTCTSGVPGGGNCVLTVEFKPVRVGLHHDTLTLQNNGLATPALVDLTGIGSGVGPETEAPLNFGTIPFGTTAVLPLTITNVGVSGTVTVSTSVSSDPSFKVLTNAQNTCLAGISSGQSCVLPVEFAPSSLGVHSTHVTVTPSGGGAATNVPLYGVASAAP